MIFDDDDDGNRYGVWAQRGYAKMRPRALFGAALVALMDAWLRRQSSAALDGSLPLPCGHVSAGDVQLLLGLWLVFCFAAARVFREPTLRRWNGLTAVAFAVLQQAPALRRFQRQSSDSACLSSTTQLEEARFHEYGCFVIAVLGYGACLAPLRPSISLIVTLAACACWSLPALNGGDAATDFVGMRIGAYHSLCGVLLVIAMVAIIWGRDRVARSRFRAEHRQAQALAAAQEELTSLRAQVNAHCYQCCCLLLLRRRHRYYCALLWPSVVSTLFAKPPL